VLARTRDDAGAVPLAELGLPDEAEYLGFEFWTRRPLGVVRGALQPGPIDPRFGVQVVCLRPRLERPQLVATSRHVTCGGPELREVSWKDDVLSGVSELVAGDPYEIYLNEPAGFQYVGTEAEGARVAGQVADGATRLIRLESEQGGVVRWKVQYRIQP
jgi:hypothetical protein